MVEIKRIRKDKGMTRAKLGAVSGVHPATINRIERGETSPTVETLEKLAGALEVEMQELFPKAQEELWESIGVVWRPPHDFQAVRKGVEDFLDQNEWMLENSPDFLEDSRARRQFALALGSLTPTLRVAVDTEVEELVRSSGQLPSEDLKDRTLTGPLYDRLLNIARDAQKILECEPDVRAAEPGEESKTKGEAREVAEG